MDSGYDSSREDLRSGYVRDNSNTYADNNDISRHSSSGSSDRNYSNSRDRSDSYHRNNRRNDSEYHNDDNRYSHETSLPSTKIIIKGISAETTEELLRSSFGYDYQPIHMKLHHRGGYCKAFAFVEFQSEEASHAFMSNFTDESSSAEGRLVVDRKVLHLEYVHHNYSKHNGANSSGENDCNDGRNSLRNFSWICEMCQFYNFSKRSHCLQCNQAKTEHCIMVPSTNASTAADGISDIMVQSHTPTPYLVVKGISTHTDGTVLADVFRDYAHVKNVHILQDYVHNVSKCVAFVEFHSIDSANHVYDCVVTNNNTLYMNDNALCIQYADVSLMTSIIQQSYYDYQMHQQQLAMQNNMYSMACNATNTATASTASVATQKVKPQWPPHFDTSGSAYVFQSSSGYFWEPVSQFYYLSKQKLYYNTTDGTYYTYDSSCDPPYVKYDVQSSAIPTATAAATVPTSSSDTSSIAVASASVISTAPVVVDVTKKPVILTVAGGASTSLLVKTKAKKILSDMSKWEAISKLNDADDATATAVAVPVFATSSKHAKAAPIPSIVTSNCTITATAATATVTQASSSVSMPSTAIATAVGSAKPVCYVCKRQFVSVEQLHRHEKESALHKDNLLKLGDEATTTATAATTTTANANASNYRDRASERRAVFGLSDDAGRVDSKKRKATACDIDNQRQGISTNITTHAVTAATAPIPLSKVESNTGNVLLRKMGWTEGQGLGKDNKGREDIIQSTSTNSVSGTGSTSKLGIGNSISNMPPVQYKGTTAEYKESLKIAARYRYEQLNKK